MERRTLIIVGDTRLARTAELEHLLSDRFEVIVYDGGDLGELAAHFGDFELPASVLGIAGGAGLALEAGAKFPVDRLALCEPLLGYGPVELVAQPTLLVACEEGGARPRRTARALWRLLPDSQLRQLAGEEADPFALAELLEDFFGVSALAGAGLA